MYFEVPFSGSAFTRIEVIKDFGFEDGSDLHDFKKRNLACNYTKQLIIEKLGRIPEGSGIVLSDEGDLDEQEAGFLLYYIYDCNNTRHTGYLNKILELTQSAEWEEYKAEFNANFNAGN
ncbi:MAG TPA: hypothetical protein VHO03_10475 [Ignavibacteriales bacterium]|nr:hypothetical protein [Ignavibacteriales bacterium]